MTRRRALLVVLACAAVAALGAVVDTDRFLRSWLIAWVSWTGLALGCLGVLLLWHVVGGAWGSVVRRPLEAAAATVPWLALGFVPVALGLARVYPWAHVHDGLRDPLHAFRDAWLSPGFFLGRAAFYFACWTIAALRLRRWSLGEDVAPSKEAAEGARRFAGPALFVFALTVTFAAVDWTMSLEPEWSSAAYGAVVIAGDAVTAIAFVILVLAATARTTEIATRLLPQHVHDLGNLLLMFVMLWAYVSFGQYLVLWSGNLPEETPWLLRRTSEGWQWLGWSLLVLHFLLPFLVLLSRDVKRRVASLGAVAGAVAVLRVVEQFWLVGPAFDERLSVHWLDPLLFAAVGCAWLAGFTLLLRAAPLLPRTFDEAPRGLAHE